MAIKERAATMRLDQIAEAWRAYDEAMLASGGEVTPDSEAELARIDLAERGSVDAFVVKIRSLEAKAQSMKDLADEATRKRRGAETEIERLYGRIGEFMAARHVEAIAGEMWRIQYERNGGSMPVELTVQASDPAFPGRFVKPLPPPPPVAADMDLLRQALKIEDPEAVAVARLVPGKHLQIR